MILSEYIPTYSIDMLGTSLFRLPSMTKTLEVNLAEFLGTSK